MGIDYKNSEGYPDPTYHAAMTNMARERKKAHPSFRPVVYICGPYSGEAEADTEKEARFCRFALEKGAIDAYGDMGVKTDCKAALTVLQKLKEKDLKFITRRDIMRHCRWVGTAEEAQALLNNLEDYGYVRLVSIDESDKLRNGRPRNALYAVNLKLFS